MFSEESLVQDDRSTSARIRDEAMGLFAQRGVDAVALREVAEAARVSAPLIIHHFGSKAGLHAAVDAHVAELVADVLATLDAPGDVDVSSGIAALLEDALLARPHLLAYLRRMLIDGGETANNLFSALHAATVTSFAGLQDAGLLRASDEDGLRAAFLLANDLAAVLLREPIRATTGIDPLAGPGLDRWTAVLMDVYTRGVFASGTDRQPPMNEESAS